MLRSFLNTGRGLFLLLASVLPSALLPSCHQKEGAVAPRPYSRIKTTAVEETPEGATFRGEVYYYGPARIVDHGFEWADSPDPAIAHTYRHSLGPKESTGPVTARVTSSLDSSRWYYLRAYVRDGNYTVYGNEISFLSKGSPAPVIEGVHPARITFNDTITIRGKHFNMLFSQNKVWLNEQEVRVLSASDTTLRVKVPTTLNQARVKVSVKTAERYVWRENAFRLAPPEILAFTPQSGNAGTVVTITGANFHPQASYNWVQFGNQVNVEVVEAVANRLVVRLFSSTTPQAVGPVPIKVTVTGQTAIAAAPFTLVSTQ